MRRFAFRVVLLVACIATAATGALLATSQVTRAAAIATPLLAGVLLLLASRRSAATRPRKLAERISELNEQLQGERIESANRFAELDARVAALEDEQLQVADARTRHREELRQIRHAVAAHHTAIDLTVAGTRD